MSQTSSSMPLNLAVSCLSTLLLFSSDFDDFDGALDAKAGGASAFVILTAVAFTAGAIIVGLPMF